MVWTVIEVRFGGFQQQKTSAKLLILASAAAAYVVVLSLVFIKLRVYTMEKMRQTAEASRSHHNNSEKDNLFGNNITEMM